ncbi:hypothetical protein NUH88_09060 [Nisaea acidiphila]|uniref:Methyltransferase type 11 domain-containing protein n=1 Tax=Nisaea acidiphila TaxID=1862145 RepID=A0A9J7B2E8_9PROT|nr:hypothetical protein [Nisaea acidiphila]UUX51837.1 hypothetical protein NUH88_09060 [Nisaea acidiphila]
MFTALHVGCGRQSTEILPAFDWGGSWKEVRVDIDPAVSPDIVDDISSLSSVPDGSAHMLFSKHNIEHLDYHQVPSCFANFHRVLDDTGFAILRTPDLKLICESILENGPEAVHHHSLIEGQMRAVKLLDMLFGASWAIEEGNHFMAHRTAFTAESLRAKLYDGGFEHVQVFTDARIFELRAIALKKVQGNVFWQETGQTPPAHGVA